jgi:4-hydroxy-3-methylbut-2-en-1-yl diphosphate reductase
LQNNISIIDASCPVVLKLQASIRGAYDEVSSQGGQIVIYGKKGHAEVVGLLGQTFNQAKVISGIDDLDILNFNQPIRLFAQTTRSAIAYEEIACEIDKRLVQIHGKSHNMLTAHNTICRLVANRSQELIKFSEQHDVVLFVSDRKSSNGKYLYDICKKQNPSSYFISSFSDIQVKKIENASSIGICGATSTPKWLMLDIKQKLHGYFQK